MLNSELLTACTALLFRIQAVTGWKVPDSELFENVLISEMCEFLKEGYSDMNLDEVAFAIRNYSSSVKEWGKNLNLVIIGECLNAYLKERRDVSEAERREVEKSKHTAEIENKPITANWSEVWEYLKEQAKKGRLEFLIIPEPIYGWLLENEMLELSVEDKKDAFLKAAEKYKSELMGKLALGQITREEKYDLQALNESGWEEKNNDLKIRVANKAKRQIVKELLISESI
jgi:hypothetical protein